MRRELRRIACIISCIFSHGRRWAVRVTDCFEGSSLIRGFDFKTDITFSTIERASFDETLTAVSNEGKDVGFYHCGIEVHGSRCINVVEKSEYNVGTAQYTTNLTSQLDLQLNINSETLVQSLTTPKSATRKCLRVHRELDKYVVEFEVKVNDAVTKESKIYTEDTLDRFLGHGALLLFQRIYIITSSENTTSLSSMDDKGTVCRFLFEHLGEKTVHYGADTVPVFGTQQTLHLPTGSDYTIQKYFTVDGQLISMVQVGLPVVFRAKQLPLPITKPHYMPKSHAQEGDFYWEDNMELASKFNERKDQLKSDFHLYFYDHPEFTDMIKDFLQAVLMEKPEDTLNFAADYFTTFSTRQILPSRLKRT